MKGWRAGYIRAAGKMMERQKELIRKYLKIKTKFQQITHNPLISDETNLEDRAS